MFADLLKPKCWLHRRPRRRCSRSSTSLYVETAMANSVNDSGGDGNCDIVGANGFRPSHYPGPSVENWKGARRLLCCICHLFAWLFAMSYATSASATTIATTTTTYNACRQRLASQPACLLPEGQRAFDEKTIITSRSSRRRTVATAVPVLRW